MSENLRGIFLTHTVQCVFVQIRTIDVPERVRDAELKDIRVIRTIGVGGFGRVELVRFSLN